MSTVFRMNTGDLQPYLQATLLNPDNTPVNLTDATVLFIMSQKGITLLSRAAIIVNAAAGVVQYNWQPGDTNQYGSCKGVFVVTFLANLTQTFPVGADLNIVFPQKYQQFTTLDEVISQLNISGPNEKGEFTIFGLPVSADSVQAQVDHANKYLSSIVPGLASTDLRYSSAELAALAIACVGTLVTASGGMLLGAFDYRLGDIFVTKGSVAKAAFVNAINAFQKDAADNLANVSTVSYAVRSSRHIPHDVGPELSP